MYRYSAFFPSFTLHSTKISNEHKSLFLYTSRYSQHTHIHTLIFQLSTDTEPILFVENVIPQSVRIMCSCVYMWVIGENILLFSGWKVSGEYVSLCVCVCVRCYVSHFSLDNVWHTQASRNSANTTTILPSSFQPKNKNNKQTNRPTDRTFVSYRCITLVILLLISIRK